MISGQPGRATANQAAFCAQLIGESTWVGPNSGIGDEPGLQISATRA